MSGKCGFILNELCCCDDMECYGEKCAYPAIENCPVHSDESTVEDVTKNSVAFLKEEVRMYRGKIDIYKHEVNRLRAVIETQNKLIDMLEECVNGCDPWICEQMKERLKGGS
jgi:chaperonin GroEL (HSP60 family)